ncbi:MAG: hypothetical protein ABSA49_18935 [Rhizomicrobium sp.]|jgi:hypothetical protein
MSNEGEALGQATVALIRLVFSPLFPIITVSVCGVSYLLTFGFHLPQFGLWAWLAGQAVAYAQANFLAMLVLAAFVLGALPLALVGFREHATRTSGVIGGWVWVAIISGGTIWAATAWPADEYPAVQQYVFAFLLFWAWTSICEVLMSTLKLIAQNRPQPGPEVVVAQKAHGDAQLAGEAEALSLLKSKK